MFRHHRPQDTIEQCIPMKQRIKAKISIHHHKHSHHMGQINRTTIKRRSMKQRTPAMCMANHDLRRQSIIAQRSMKVMFQIHAMCIIHPAAYQSIRIIPICHLINRAQSKHICTKRRQPIQRIPFMSRQVVVNICHTIDMLKHHHQSKQHHHHHHHMNQT